MTEFVWDYRNRLSGVVVKDSGGAVLQETVFTYDVADRRIGKRVDPDGPGPQAAVQLWTVYDGVNPYADFDGAGSLTTRYLADPNQPDVLFARVAAGGTAEWYLRDNINSVRQVVSTTGAVLNAITYDSFGNVLAETNPAAGDRFKYTGREYDAELGIYYYRARYYDPATGRFLGEDPKSFAAGDSNLYRYVANTPTGRIDPMGLDWADWVVSQMPSSWVDYLGSSRSNWIGHTSNYFAGHADALTFGLTSYARRGLGWDNVNYNSDYYLGGQIGGSIHSFALGYGAAGRVPQAGVWAYRGAQWYTAGGAAYGVGHSSYVLATDPQNFGFTDALGFLPLGGYVTSFARLRPAAGRVTGAFQEGYPGFAERGLGILANREIMVTESGLARLEQHLARFGHDPANAAMVQRLRDALANGGRVRGADASFYLHEIYEATLMSRGMSYNMAHSTALNRYGVSSYSVYHPEVIRANPNQFNSNWSDFWEEWARRGIYP